MEEFNWSAGLSSAGTILSTGADMYLSIQQGEIKALQHEMKVNQIRTGQIMAGYDKDTMIASMEAIFAQESADMAKQYAGVGEDQMMSAILQNRTMDSLASTQAVDENAYQSDQMMSLLNKNSQQHSAEADYNRKIAVGNADMNSLTTAAGIERSQGNINAANAGLKGLTTLTKNNAFDEEYYLQDASDDGSSPKVKKAMSYGDSKKAEFLKYGGYSDPFKGK